MDTNKCKVVGKEICTDRAPAAIGPYSQGKQIGNLLCVSGQLPVNPSSGEIPDTIEAQAEQALENLKNVLAAAGAGVEDVVKTTVYLADIQDFAAVNLVYERYFTKPYPARAAFQVAALPKAALVEIEAFAWCDANQ